MKKILLSMLLVLVVQLHGATTQAALVTTLRKDAKSPVKIAQTIAPTKLPRLRAVFEFANISQDFQSKQLKPQILKAKAIYKRWVVYQALFGEIPADIVNKQSVPPIPRIYWPFIE